MDAYGRILQEAVDTACADGADIVHDVHRTARWSPQQARIWIQLRHDDRGCVSLDRLRHWSEGYSSYSRRIDLLKPDATKRFRRLVHDEVSLVARLQRRDAESEARCGTRYEPCPTTFTCHPVGLALALHAGYPREGIEAAALERFDPGHRALQDTHDAISRSHLHATNQRRIRIRGERILFRDIETPHLSYTDITGEGPVLTVACELPDTAMAAVGGMTLAGVVGHDALDGLPDVRIRRVARGRLRDAPAVVLHLQRLSAPLATKENIS